MYNVPTYVLYIVCSKTFEQEKNLKLLFHPSIPYIHPFYYYYECLVYSMRQKC